MTKPQAAWQIVRARERDRARRQARDARDRANRDAAARIAARRAVPDRVPDADLDVPPRTEAGLAEMERRRVETLRRAINRIARARESWFDDAACKGKSGLFFAPAGESHAAAATRTHAARVVCACCPVSEQCRDAGRAGREFGIWGGEDEIERARAGSVAPLATRRQVRAAAAVAREVDRRRS